MDSIVDLVILGIGDVGFIPLFLLGLVISLFFFWNESHAHKDRNSVFDMWVATILLAMLWGRISFIIVNWEMFANLPWSLAPYERYGDAIYFFRLLPWRFFDLSDGGFLFTSIFAAYLLFAFLYNMFIKKWRWREMFFSVIISAEVFLCATLIVYGALSGFKDVVEGGLIISLLIFLFLFLITVLRFIFKKKKKYSVELVDGIIHLFVILFVLMSFILINRLFLSYEISSIDKVNVVLMNLMGIIATLYFVFIEKKSSGQRESLIMNKGRSVTININVNKPLKLRDEEN